MNSEEIAKYLSKGGEIKKIKSGFAIGYVPVDCSAEIDDMAEDTINVMLCSYNGNSRFLEKREKAKGKSYER